MSEFVTAERGLDGRHSVWHPGLAALVAAKTGDILTTAVGLVFVEGVVELNPLAAASMEALGIGALAVLGFAGVAVVTVTVETAASVIERVDSTELDPTVVYLLGYLPLSMVFTMATFHNAGVILTLL